MSVSDVSFLQCGAMEIYISLTQETVSYTLEKIASHSLIDAQAGGRRFGVIVKALRVST